MPNIFLSYSRDDSLIMGIIRDNLRNLGFELWIDHENLVVGTTQWEHSVQEAIEQTDCMLVLCSPAAKQSKWVLREVSLADELNKLIIPILIDGEAQNAIPLRLLDNQYCDMRGRSDPERGFRSLVAGLAKQFSVEIPKFNLVASSSLQIPTVQVINVAGNVEAPIVTVGGNFSGEMNVAKKSVTKSAGGGRPAKSSGTVQSSNSQNKLDVVAKELQSLFDFSEADLASNQVGKLSTRQKRKYLRPIRQRAYIGFAMIAIAILLFAIDMIGKPLFQINFNFQATPLETYLSLGRSLGGLALLAIGGQFLVGWVERLRRVSIKPYKFPADRSPHINKNILTLPRNIEVIGDEHALTRLKDTQYRFEIYYVRVGYKNYIVSVEVKSANKKSA